MFILRSGLTSTASHPDRDFCRGGGRVGLYQLYLKISFLEIVLKRKLCTRHLL